jgi:hypothetical protein
MTREQEAAKAKRQGRTFKVLPPCPQAATKSARRNWRLVAVGGMTAGHSYHQRPRQRLNVKTLFQHSDKARVLAVATGLLGDDFVMVDPVGQ